MSRKNEREAVNLFASVCGGRASTPGSYLTSEGRVAIARVSTRHDEPIPEHPAAGMSVSFDIPVAVRGTPEDGDGSTNPCWPSYLSSITLSRPTGALRGRGPENYDLLEEESGGEEATAGCLIDEEARGGHKEQTM
ncbi:unnamed protein product [Lota lota]